MTPVRALGRLGSNGPDGVFDPPTVLKWAGAVRRFWGISLCRIVCRTDMEAETMVREDGKRNFALRESGGDETSVFSGNTPRQAALKAARRLEPGSSEDAADRIELRLREKGTDKVHIYDGWAWEETAPDDKPDWMPEEITEANVAKKGIEHLEE